MTDGEEVLGCLLVASCGCSPGLPAVSLSPGLGVSVGAGGVKSPARSLGPAGPRLEGPAHPSPFGPAGPESQARPAQVRGSLCWWGCPRR